TVASAKTHPTPSRLAVIDWAPKIATRRGGLLVLHLPAPLGGPSAEAGAVATDFCRKQPRREMTRFHAHRDHLWRPGRRRTGNHRPPAAGGKVAGRRVHDLRRRILAGNANDVRAR